MKIKVGGGGDSYRCAFSFHGRERFTTAFLSPELREEGIDAWMAATTLWRERFFRWVVKRFGFGADLSFKSLLFVCIGLGMGRSQEQRVF